MGVEGLYLCACARNLMRGDLTPRAVALVIEWAMLHLDELSVCWQLAREMKPITQIAPLE